MNNLIKKLILAMSFMFLFNLFAFGQHISLIANNITVKEAMNRLQNISGYSFVYYYADVNTSKKVNISARNATVSQVVSQILIGQNLNYKIKDKAIILKKVEKDKQSKTQGTKKNNDSDPETIKGHIVDVKGEPIIGATVKVKGSSTGTVTDLDGKFSLSTLYGSILEISYIGYNSQEVKVGERTDLFVVMKENTQNLNELVVIGYGSVKKSDLTGAVSSVNADQLSKSPGFSPVAALQGRVAGVNVELSSGAPDASANIQIRGVGSPNGSTPLFVVDGFPMADINQLNPNDIENMEILKDASACAIYGSRGANGVILITTKKGHSGSTKVTLNASYGIEKLASSPEMLNATQYATLSNLASENAGNSDTYSDVNNLQYNTNWYKQITQTGQYQNYNVSVSGGSDKAQSMFSANYYGRQGLVKSTIFDRITLNENTVFKVADWLKFTSSLSVAANKGRNLNSNSVFLTSIIAPPDIPVIDPSTNYYSGITKIDIANPAGAIARNVGINKHLFVVGNFAVDLNLTKDLIFTSRFGIKVDHENDKSFTPVYYETSDQSTLMNTVSRTTNNVVDWTWENILNYHHLFAEKHDLSLMGAMSSRRYRKDYYSSFGSKNYQQPAILRFFRRSLQTGSSYQPCR